MTVKCHFVAVTMSCCVEMTMTFREVGNTILCGGDIFNAVEVVMGI